MPLQRHVKVVWSGWRCSPCLERGNQRAPRGIKPKFIPRCWKWGSDRLLNLQEEHFILASQTFQFTPVLLDSCGSRRYQAGTMICSVPISICIHILSSKLKKKKKNSIAPFFHFLFHAFSRWCGSAGFNSSWKCELARRFGATSAVIHCVPDCCSQRATSRASSHLQYGHKIWVIERKRLRIELTSGSPSWV